ncbi:MAG: RNA polymerase subunit Rpo13 [Ignisphaera sp.]
MVDEEVVSEVAEEEASIESVEEEYFGEDVEVEGLSISDVELFLSRAEIWDNLLQNRISINEAKSVMASLGIPHIEETKPSTKRSRKKKSS